MESCIMLIVTIVSGVVAVVSLITTFFFRRAEKKEQFEELMFKTTNSISTFLYDAYDVQSQMLFLSVDKIVEAEKSLTEGFTSLEVYGKVHNNKNVVNFAVIKSTEDEINEISFSYHLLIVLDSYKQFRLSKINQQMNSSEKDTIGKYIEILWKFVDLYTKYIRSVFYKYFLTCKCRQARAKEQYYAELKALVKEAKEKGLY